MSTGGGPAISTRAISVSRLRKTYRDVVAVDDVSFEVEHGEIFGIIGPNGSGKTTTVECLQGLRDPDSGGIDILGLDPRTQRNSLRHRIGSQLQESSLPDRMRVWEALDLFGAMSPRSRDWESLARDWGIHEKRNSAFATLSGGQRQRLFIALALVNQPELVFLDEMTTGLDPAARHDAWSLIRGVREQGTTVVLVTHFMEEAEALCDRVAVFQGGTVLAVDSVPGLVARYAGQSTVRFTSREDLPWLAGVDGVEQVTRDGSTVMVQGSGPLLAYVGAALVAHGLAPVDLRVERGTLEDVFLNLSRAGAGR
ncbi:MAG: ABC transporter ATP-binding protein [Dehalococcoidia bacterium]|nr:ABC transporter ATP-binding protein [Dehalococcoidia bacterium]